MFQCCCSRPIFAVRNVVDFGESFSGLPPPSSSEAELAFSHYSDEALLQLIPRSRRSSQSSAHYKAKEKFSEKLRIKNFLSVACFFVFSAGWRVCKSCRKNFKTRLKREFQIDSNFIQNTKIGRKLCWECLNQKFLLDLKVLWG